MTLLSMTGFGRAEGQIDDFSWSWELRSVNGKGLDVRLRLPAGFEHLEQHVRKSCQQKLSRGNIQVALSVNKSGGQSNITVNSAALQTVMKTISDMESTTDLAPSSAAQILSLRGVIESETEAPTDAVQKQLDSAILGALNDALSNLLEHKKSEGAELKSVLKDQLDQMMALTNTAQNDPNRSAEAITEKLRLQVGKLLGATSSLDESRLHQEAALIATKADIAEELDRLSAHFNSAHQLLDEGSPAGRKLEFIAQELNREANTLCSKSNAVSVTETGLALKVVIDQFREQVLNVE